MKHSWQAKLSWEVEKIVPIPLSAFFDPENYAVYSLEVPEKLVAQGIPSPWEFPGLVHRENGEEEILWGATFKVIQTFFQIVFDFSFPSPDSRANHPPPPGLQLSDRQGRLSFQLKGPNLSSLFHLTEKKPINYSLSW